MTGGGDDEANFFGSSAVDRISARADHPLLKVNVAVWDSSASPTWYNRVAYDCEVVNIHMDEPNLAGGGNDIGWLYDSTGNDFLEADDDRCRLSNSAADWLFEIDGLNAGDTLTPFSGAGGTDSDNIVTPLDYTLNLGSW